MGFLIKFVAAYLVGHALYFALPDDMLRDVVIHYGIVAPSAALVNLVAPSGSVQATAHVLASPRATLEVVRGCDGIGTALLLTAAIVAFPAAWRRKLPGLALGLALVYAANLARIVGLYFVVAYRNEWFLVLHSFLVPIAFIALIAAFFGWWVSPGAEARDTHAALP